MTHLAAVHVFNGRFSEREIDVISVSERTDEIRSCRTATRPPPYKNIQKNEFK